MFNRLLSNTLATAIFVMATILYTPAIAQEQITISPLFREPGVNSIYEIKFTPTKAIPADAQFKVIFPEGFDLTKVKIAGSSTINGGFKTSVKDSVVLIERSGLGNIVAAGENVDLQFTTVKNPVTDKNYTITVEIQEKDGRLISKKLNTVNIRQKAE